MTTYRPSLPFTMPARPRGQWTGWGISLAVHACVLAWLLHLVPARLPDTPAPSRMRFVLIPPREPVPEPVPVNAVPIPGTPATASVPIARKPPATAPRPSRARAAPVETPAAQSPSAASSEATPVITAAEPDPAAAAPADSAKGGSDNAPAFDMAAARASARLIARHAKDGTVALPERKAPSYEPDDSAQRGLERARRNDCRSAYAAMGVLAVLPLLKDAVTGSGCKW